MPKKIKDVGLTYAPGSFERYMRNLVRKDKLKRDEVIIAQMLEELKKKNESEKQRQIDDLTEKLEKLKKG